MLEKPDEFIRAFPLSPLFGYIYKQCTIDLNDYYETSAYIMYRMHISQNEQDSLEFYVWNNIGKYLTNIIEKENEANSGKGTENEKSYMAKFNNMKNSMKQFTAPKSPKLK